MQRKVSKKKSTSNKAKQNKGQAIASFLYLIYNDSMPNNIDKYKELQRLFYSHGFKLFLVGGTVRNCLLSEQLDDMDLVTDATPEEMHSFLSGNYRFEKYGCVSLKIDGTNFDITTLREENGYLDKRHPDEIHFTKDLRKDVLRRDFTINALYMDENGQVYDFVGGQNDLKNRLLKIIGDPDQRLKEDPLRIIRALRFSLTYNFTISDELKASMKRNIGLLDSINPEKIKQDLRKIKCDDKEKIQNLFDEFSIHHLLNMLE